MVALVTISTVALIPNLGIVIGLDRIVGKKQEAPNCPGQGLWGTPQNDPGAAETSNTSYPRQLWVDRGSTWRFGVLTTGSMAVAITRLYVGLLGGVTEVIIGL